MTGFLPAIKAFQINTMELMSVIKRFFHVIQSHDRVHFHIHHSLKNKNEDIKATIPSII